MSDLQTGKILSPNTTAIAPIDINQTRPELREVSSFDFQSFSATGISVEIPVPLVKTSSEALFGVNIDGFIPTFNYTSSTNFQVFRNLFPVQASYRSLNVPGLRILYEMSAIPALNNYLSHRYIEGQVGIGVRVTANTGMSGNLMITQASGISRAFYASSQAYAGLRFENQSMCPIDYAPAGFTLLDISLNRQVLITPIRRDVARKMDLAQKIDYLTEFASTSSDNFYVQQFSEDWLLFGLLNNIVHPSTATLTLTFFFDWSHVKFSMPMLATVPVLSNFINQQILLVTETLKEITTPQEFTNWKWWPLATNILRKCDHQNHAIFTSPVHSDDHKRITYYLDVLKKHKNLFEREEYLEDECNNKYDPIEIPKVPVEPPKVPKVVVQHVPDPTPPTND